MAGISSKAFGGVENRYKYNGIELDTSLGLNEYEAQLRDLDPQTGRWWQVDPETEDQGMWSPYTSNYDNPILYKDPRGNEGEACCGGIVQLGEGALDIYRAVRGGENILDVAKNNGITWKSVVNGLGKAISFDQGGQYQLPAKDDLKSTVLTLPADTHVFTLPADTKVNSKKIHANSDASNKLNARYKKYDKKGRFRKNGITSKKPIESRYSKKEMDGGYMESIETGSRKQMRINERNETETNPGPDNHEPWAGKRKSN